MTRAIPTPCQHTGCGLLVRGGGYCAEHNVWRKRREAKPERARESSSARGYGADWRRLRQMILAREPLCRECGKPASEVDHITPRARGGSDRRENLQALCHACHSRKTLRDGDGRQAVEMIIVTGAPGAGKSTWVAEHMREGDALWDWDAMLAAICPSGYIEQRMRPALRALRATFIGAPWAGRAYIVITDPEMALQMSAERGARLVVIDPGIDEGMRRAERRAIERGGDLVAVRAAVSGWAAQAAALAGRLPLGVGGSAPSGVRHETIRGPHLSRAPEKSDPQTMERRGHG